jgi:hypothetical protein
VQHLGGAVHVQQRFGSASGDLRLQLDYAGFEPAHLGA